MKAKHSLWQQPCGRHGWIGTKYVLYKEGIVNCTNSWPILTIRLNSYMLDAAISDYDNGFAFKQTYTSLHGMWKTDDFDMF